MVKPYIPDRGDIVWLDFDPQAGPQEGEADVDGPGLHLRPDPGAAGELLLGRLQLFQQRG